MGKEDDTGNSGKILILEITCYDIYSAVFNVNK